MKVSISEIRERAEKLFECVGVTKEDAAIITDVILETEMRGVFTHGFFRVPRYVSCIKKGGIKAKSELKLDVDLPSMAAADGEGGLGIILSYKAMKLAIEKAKATGIGMVCVRGSHHFGAAGYYTSMCANEGMLGMSMSNGDALVAVTNSRMKSIGNNPFSYSAPAGKYGKVVYDIAMSPTSDIKVLQLAKEGKSCPDGWVIDKNGNASNDPNDYINGGVLIPFGGYKGYGLAMMVEVMAGVLSGSALTLDVHAWNSNPETSGNVGHMFLAVDIDRLMGIDKFNERMEKMLDGIKATPLADGAKKIYYPGEIEAEKMAACLDTGFVEIADDTYVAFEACERELGLR